MNCRQVVMAAVLLIPNTFQVVCVADDWVQTIAAVRLWPVDEGGNGHAYQAVATSGLITWTSADRAATLAGGYLATVTSEQENKYVFDLISTDSTCWRRLTDMLYMGPWLGGYQPEGAPEPAGGWLWVTGEPFEYTAWLPVEPSGPGEDRLHYMGRTGSPEAAWNDQSNENTLNPFAYLVEYDPVTFEAEDAAIADGPIETAFVGYSGAGYVRLDGSPDAVRWVVDLGMTGPKGLLVRYSNGTSQGIGVEVAVNGVVVEPNLFCAPTGAWDVWSGVTAHAFFNPGRNVIEIRSLIDNAGLAIDKVTVFDGNTNLAMDRRVACSTETPGYPASQAIDADTRTCWKAQNLPQWLEVDLGDVYPVHRTQLVGSVWQACRFRVEVKARAEDAYIEVVDRAGDGMLSTEPLVDTFEPTPARYVRLTVTSTDWGDPEIAEFRISAAAGQVSPIAIGAVGYRTIQTAIDAAEHGDVITLQPGRYSGAGGQGIDMKGKRVTLTSIDPNDSRIVATAIIEGTEAGPAVSVTSGEDANCVLAGLTITGARTAVYCDHASPTIHNCRLVGNSGAGIELYSYTGPTIRHCVIAGNRGAGIRMDSPQGRGGMYYNYPQIINCTIVENRQFGIKGGNPTVVNSIIYVNGADSNGTQITGRPSTVAYSDVQGGWPGDGNLDVDPRFARSGSWDGPDGAWIAGDYHLQSQAGRWDVEAQKWVVDTATSACVDAGDPAMSPGQEPSPNGGRINLGAYGGTGEASTSPPQP